MLRSPEELARDAVLATVVDLERQLLDPAFRADPEAVGDLLHDDFEEVGGAGRHWHRDAMIDQCARNPGPGTELSQLDAGFVTGDVVLITYAARDRGAAHAVARCTSVWVRGPRGWQLRHHQGTPVT